MCPLIPSTTLTFAFLDQAIARGLFEDELKQYQISRKIELPPITKSTNLLPPKAPEPQIVRFNCNSCEDLFDADHCYPAPCQHYYCDGCMDNLFRLSLTDERIYPPRCCTTHYIPLDDVRLFLDKDLVIEFEAKKEELDDTKRTYCYVPTCSKYIGQSNKEGNTGTCPACAAQTCKYLNEHSGMKFDAGLEFPVQELPVQELRSLERFSSTQLLQEMFRAAL